MKIVKQESPRAWLQLLPDGHSRTTAAFNMALGMSAGQVKLELPVLYLYKKALELLIKNWSFLKQNNWMNFEKLKLLLS